MAAIAARCGLSRRAVYDAAEGIMGDEVQHLLSQILAEVLVQEMIAEAAGLAPGPEVQLARESRSRNR
jgi:hypothetical protein